MNTLVLFDAHYSQTEHLAKEIVEKLKEHGDAEMIPIRSLTLGDIARADLLVLGAPPDDHGLTPAIREFLDNVPPSGLLGKHVAVFDTREHGSWLGTGSAAHRVARRVRGLGAVLVAGPMSFVVSSPEGPIDVGEELKADEWAHLVVRKSRNLN